MSLYGYILVLYYAHYAINFDENTFYFNFTTTFTSYIVITFSFSYHYTFTTSWLKQKTLFFLLITKLISPLRLLRQDLKKCYLKNLFSFFHCYYYYHVHYRVILTKKILFWLSPLLFFYYLIHVFYYLRPMLQHVMIKIILFSFLYYVHMSWSKEFN